MAQWSEFLKISPKISVMPVVHGNGDSAIEVRRVMLSHSFDCLAVPLPKSFQEPVERAIEFLPSLFAVVQKETTEISSSEWKPDSDEDDDDDYVASYVPIDPCQAVITAIKIAMQEHIPRHFIDMETKNYEPITSKLPDPYALKSVSIEKFSAGVLPSISKLPSGQPQERVDKMAFYLRELEKKFDSILLVCSYQEWPWIKNAYIDQVDHFQDEEVDEASIYSVDPQTSLFFLGELPFITALYEKAKNELEDDENLSVDGIKSLLLETREDYQSEFGSQARPITPFALTQYLKYVRNLSLVERRMTPDLYTLITAAQQMFGDQFAILLAEIAREYEYTGLIPYPKLEMGIDQAMLPNDEFFEMKNRLPGPPVSWRTCKLNSKPKPEESQKWESRWDPFGQCSWPGEDVAIERFRTHVKDKALSLLGFDLARSEKFSTSLKDGLDMRETLRNWHTGDLYVKEIPPSRGSLDCVVMLFDSPSDPRDYPWRITWQAEHKDESTLSFYATDYKKEMVGPGIAMATYGGALFLFPPRPMLDIWVDPEFDFLDTLEERLIAAGCFHSKEKHIALLSIAPPGRAWKSIAKKYGKKILHVPLKHFSQQTVQQLRLFHVLNGQHVRSYAADFIRKA